MSTVKLSEIMLCCLSIEEAAAEMYAAFSKETEAKGHRAFWQEVSWDEKHHVSYWEELLALDKKGGLGNPFERPDLTKAELDGMKRKVDSVLREKGKRREVPEMILWAFRLESLMLHPAFPILFKLLERDPSQRQVFDEYQEHIDKFLHFVNRVLGNSPEMELMGEVLSNMWKRSADLANQLAQIRVLRGFLPICASCKKIRDDRGYWNQIESYIKEHSEAVFSHSICPECAERLYPGEWNEDKE